MRLLFIIIILYKGTLFAQTNGQIDPKQSRKIARHAQKAPDNVSFSAYYLSQYLTTEATTDFEKAYSFYVWIANNITYDIKGFKTGNLPDYRTKAVLYNKTAVCEGYARLFKELCDEAGLRCEIIHGFSKGYGYSAGQKFNVANHSWNAIWIEDNWYLVDATWATRKTNESFENRPLTDRYFLPSPSLFIQDHLPEIPAWQLLKSPITKRAFERDTLEFLSNNYQYADSLEKYLNQSAQERTISYQLQARAFNPGNDDANYKLGLEYRFRGLDIIEAVYDVQSNNMDRFETLEKEAFESFDEAALYFSLIRPRSRYYKSAQVFLDDTDFERGVFKYEVAHRMLEIYNNFSQENKSKYRLYYEETILDNYEEAAIYFERISQHSWYYEKAREYIEYYLLNPFKESTLIR